MSRSTDFEDKPYASEDKIYVQVCKVSELIQHFAVNAPPGIIFAD